MLEHLACHLLVYLISWINQHPFSWMCTCLDLEISDGVLHDWFTYSTSNSREMLARKWGGFLLSWFIISQVFSLIYKWIYFFWLLYSFFITTYLKVFHFTILWSSARHHFQFVLMKWLLLFMEWSIYLNLTVTYLNWRYNRLQIS